MMETNLMMVVPPKLQPYYSMGHNDSLEDSDDEKYNYVIDLDYKGEEESTSSESDVKSEDSTDKSSSDKCSSKSPNSKCPRNFSPVENQNTERSRNDSSSGYQNEKLEYDYTLDNSEVLDLRSGRDLVKRSGCETAVEAKTETVERNENTVFNYTLDTGSVLDLTNNKQHGDTHTGSLGSKSHDSKEHDNKNQVPLDNSKDTSSYRPNSINIGAAIDSKTGVTNECNKQVSDMYLMTQSKPVGASKRKRKFTLESAISNIIKSKTVCTRDLSYNDNSEARQSSPDSMGSPRSISSPSSVSATGPASSQTSLSPFSSPVSVHSTFNNQHSMDAAFNKRFPVNMFSKPTLMSSSPLNHLDMSPSVLHPEQARLMDGSTLVSSKLSSIMSSTVFTKQPSVSLPKTPKESTLNQPTNLIQNTLNTPTNLTQKSSSRRKSSVVYRSDTFIGDSNNSDTFIGITNTDNVLDMTVKKDISEMKKSTDMSNNDVMDLSKPTKAKDLPNSDKVGVEIKHEPVDLTYNSKVAEDERKPPSFIKTEPKLHNVKGQEQLNVMDIFKDMMTQNGRGGGAGGVSIQQFTDWMRKMHPMAMENMNMMELSAYYMQFNYWMQAFFNNPVMNGASPNLKGNARRQSAPENKSRRKYGGRKDLPVPFAHNNTSPVPPQVYYPEDEDPHIKDEKPEVDKVSDYNSNNISIENTEFAKNPEFSELKEKYSCIVSERDGKIKFLVKDNAEINSIANSVLQVADLGEPEMESLDRDENGLCPRFVCRICDQKFFHREHMSKHVKTTHIQKRFQCDQCERSFHDAGNYRQHVRVHDESDIPYECPECNRRFRHKCTLKVHMRIHTGEKPFKCHVCEASFKISSGLQTHMRKHTGETPYACEFCSLRFKCQSNLKQHLFQHTQNRPFPCELCGKSYSRKSIRDSHMLTHYRNASLTKDLNVTI